MAVETFYMSTLDKQKTQFTSKKDADAHDKMLQAAYAISDFLVRKIDSVDEATGEEVGLLLARHTKELEAVLKGKSEVFPEGDSEDNLENTQPDDEQPLSVVG